MKGILRHLRTYIFRGLLAITPLALTFLVIRLLYVAIDIRVRRIVNEIIGLRVPNMGRFLIPGLGVLLLLIMLYILGLIASNVVGRQFFRLIEYLTRRIPLINTVYRAGKQLSTTLSLPSKQAFQRAVLVEYLKPGMWTTGFVTGTIIDKRNGGEKLLKVFVPMPPNPASGVMIIVRESQTRDPGWTVEEAFRTVISGGIIGPEEIRKNDPPS